MDELRIKTYLSSEEFLNIWKGVYISDPRYKSYYEEDYVKLGQTDNLVLNGEKSIIVNFRNIEVYEAVYLREEIEYLPINISGSVFKDMFYISNGIFTNFLIGLNSRNIFLKGLTITGGVFENSTQLSLIGSKNSCTEINIFGGIFKTKLRIWGAQNVKLDISRGHFNAGLSLNGLFDNVSITGGIYESDLDLERLICRKNFQIIGGFFSKIKTQSQEWYHDEFPKFTKFVDCGIVRHGVIYIFGDLLISNIDCKYINLGLDYKGSFSYINNLYIINFNKSLFIQTFYDNTLFINKLHVENSTILSSNIFRLSNFGLGDLVLDSVIAQGNLYFLNLKVDNKIDLDYSLLEEEFLKYKDVTLNNKSVKKIKHGNEFRIISSDLGNSNFLNCDFSNFKLIFDSSKVDNIYLAGTLFPKKVDSLEGKKLIEEKNAYSQLKKVFEKNDVQTSSEYLTNETETYRKLLDSKKGNIEDKIVLCLNRYTSNHGTNWLLTFWLILIFNLISFSFLIYTVGFQLDISINGLKNYLKLLSYLITYLNPIHRSDFLNSCGYNLEKWSSTTELVDSVSKLVNAFLIYQFIQAFRKFGKK